MTCYFGAYCLVRSGLATCECGNVECPSNNVISVCGSDGRTYLSTCHLRAHACKTQSDIVVQAFGPCGDEQPYVRRGSRSGRSMARRTDRSHTPSPQNIGSPHRKLEEIKRVKFHPNSIRRSRDDSVEHKDDGASELTCVNILPPVGYR